MNGETPTTNITLYTEPFTVSNTGGINGGSITIKAIGIKSEMNNSEVTTKAIVLNQESTITVKTTEAFETAIENNHVNTIKFGGDITGNVTQTRTESNNFTIDFDAYVLNGDLDITTNSPVSIAKEAGATVVNAITDLAIGQEELRIGDITTANITTAVSGDTYTVTSAKPSIVSVDEKTGLAITANAQGRVAVTVQVKDVQGAVRNQGIIFITVLE